MSFFAIEKFLASGSGDLAEGILQYFMQHPSAEDTASEIQQWWLLPEQRDCPNCEVVQVLEDLVRLGCLRRRDRPDGQAAYGLNQRQTSETRILLTNREGRRHKSNDR